MAASTIYDVSERAGVSIATVSRVLNSPDQVNANTRARVLAAIDELDFVPKFEALARARKGMGRIGVLTPFFTTDSFVDRLRGLVAALAGLAYEPVIYDVASVAQRDGYLMKLAVTRRVDGLVVIGLPLDDVTALRLIKHHIPTVQIVTPSQPTSHAITRILHDDAAGGQMAAEYLLARGHRHLAYIGDADGADFTGVVGDQKLDRFRQTLALAGIPLPNMLIGLAPFGMEYARQQTYRLLNLPTPPTAIFAGSDTQAIGVISAIRERGMSVPEDIAVMGFDDIEIAEFAGLTTIRQQLKESGRLAAEMLLAALATNYPITQRAAQRIDMPFTLIQRHTA